MSWATTSGGSRNHTYQSLAVSPITLLADRLLLLLQGAVCLGWKAYQFFKTLSSENMI